MENERQNKNKITHTQQVFKITNFPSELEQDCLVRGHELVDLAGGCERFDARIATALWFFVHVMLHEFH